MSDKKTPSKHTKHIDNAVKAAKEQLGSTWNIIGPKFQQAFIALHALSTLAGRTGVPEWQQAADFAQEAIDTVNT